MKNFLKYSLLALALTLTFNSSAKAEPRGRDHHEPPICKEPNTAPEVDPSLAIGGLTLLAGGLTVLRTRRQK